MRALLNIQKQLLPDISAVLKKRYTILHHIAISGVIGRRTLASSLDMTERVLRAEVDLLKAQGLVLTESYGMKISEEGSSLLEELEPMVKDLFGLTDLETELRERFGLRQVTIVPGDSDLSPYTKKELGRAAALALREAVKPGDVIAVTGGSTMAVTAEGLTASSRFKNCWFVPARGGLGETVELQANSIASTMAKNSGARYRLLHVPDHLSEEAYVSLMQEPDIQERVAIIQEAKVVLHGIGEAMVMARRRKVDDQTVRQLEECGALAEAFGYYFDREGVVRHKVPTVGLRLEDIQNTGSVIAVAGGESKAEAIVSILLHGHEDVLVTDEAAALAMKPFLQEGV